MPTDSERIRTLVGVGLLPTSAQAIVDNSLRLDDPGRMAAWLYYADRVPDRYRRLWDAIPVELLTPREG